MSDSSEEVKYRPLMIEPRHSKSWLKKQRKQGEIIMHQHQIALRAWEIFFYTKEVEKKEVKKIEEYESESESYDDEEDYYYESE